MSTATAPRTRTAKPRTAKKKNRTLRVLACLNTGAGILRITEGKEETVYFFAPRPSDFGTAFTVEKWADATEEAPAGIVQRYEVCLDGKESHCGCKGFSRWGHCRHIESLSALLDAGKVDAAPAHKPACCQHENVSQHEDGFIVCHDCGSEW